MYSEGSRVQEGTKSKTSGLLQVWAQEHITWHGLTLGGPDWGHCSHSIALTGDGIEGDDDSHMMFNAYWEDLDFKLPPRLGAGRWLRLVDTSQPSPDDISGLGQERPADSNTYLVGAHSVIVLIAHNTEG